jgi:hypothetical protein
MVLKIFYKWKLTISFKIKKVKVNQEKIAKDPLIKEILDEEVKELSNQEFFKKNENNLKANLLRNF